jgi:uncharacterized delta-60 repeat protein
LARYRTDGSLDPGFGQGGIVFVDFGGGTDNARGVAIAPGGDILVVGDSTDAGGNKDIALVRLDGAGELVSGFGDNGRAVFDFGPNDQPFDLATRPGGEIYVAANIDGGASYSALRLTPTGELDPAFGGGDGIGKASIQGAVYALTLDSAGRVLLAGSQTGPGLEDDTDFGIARLTAEGVPDATFAGDGTTSIDFVGADDGASAIAVTQLGRIVVAGGATTVDDFDDESDFGIARLSANGQLDPSFSGGKTTIDFGGFNEYATDLLLLGGSVVVAGAASEGATGPQGFGLARLTYAGQLDQSFSGNGREIVSLSEEFEEATALTPTPSGVVAAGYNQAGAEDGRFELAAFDPGPTEAETPDPDAGDRDPPETELGGKDHRRVRTDRQRAVVKFRFRSPETGVTFACRVDQGSPKPCNSPRSVPLSLGRHRFAVRAIDAAGNVDPTPAVGRIRVRPRG